MTSNQEVRFRAATIADIAAMAQCCGAADPRMAAYFEGRHDPQQALPPRAGYVALAGSQVIGYIAGHLTKRHDCDGEVQYFSVAPGYRRRRIGTALLGLLAKWFKERDAKRICVGVANDSPPEAKPFVASVGGVPLKKHWYVWEDISIVLGNR